MTDHLSQLIASPTRPHPHAIDTRGLVSSTPHLLADGTISATCHLYNNGGEVWTFDGDPSVIGYTATELTDRVIALRLKKAGVQ